MSLRIKTAVCLGAAALSASFALSPLLVEADAKKGNSCCIPLYPPKKAYHVNKLKKLLFVEPLDYQLSFLKQLWENSKDSITKTDDGGGKDPFVLRIKQLEIENGKKVSAFMKIPKTAKQDPYIDFDVTAEKGICRSRVHLSKLAERLQKEAGMELRYAVPAIEKKEDKIAYYIIPVEAFGDVAAGNIKPGVRMLIIEVDKKTGDVYSKGGRNIHNVVDGQATQQTDEAPEPAKEG